MEGNRTKALEKTADMVQFLEYCIKCDEKSEIFLQQYDIRGSNEDELKRMLFKVTRFSRIARSLAALDADIFGQRLGDNLVAVNIARWTNEPSVIKSMVVRMPAEDMVLKNSEGYSMAELVARKGDEESKMIMIERAEADALRSLKTHTDEEHVTRLLWNTGSMGVRIALSHIGASYGSIETFGDIRLVGRNVTEIRVDTQKACNSCWNWISNELLRKAAEEAVQDGDRTAASSIKRLRESMSNHRRDATPAMIGSVLDEIEILERKRRIFEKGHDSHDAGQGRP